MDHINRHNCEEYFLLYIDDELSATEKKAVEEFLQQHPDLQIELEMLQHSTLEVEPIVFHGKDVLLKNTSSFINDSNHEEYFVLYADDELTNEQKDTVEQFVYRNSQYQAEFELIQQVKLQPDRMIAFPDKNVLYRSEKEVEKVFVMRWWKIAAAAIVFISVSGLGWYIVSKNNLSPATARSVPEKSIDLPVSEKLQQKPEVLVQTKPVVPEVIPFVVKNPSISRDKRLTSSVRQGNKKNPVQTLTIPQDEKINGHGRNIQLATTVTQERAKVNVDDVAASNTIAGTRDKKPVVDEAIGEIDGNPYIYAASNNEIEILNTTVSKKNKLRGLLRKVSRVVEKTTNIEPGDNGRGIRIANFEIALK